MTFFSRPNLDDVQFEQLSGTTLTLNGNTIIYSVSGLSLSGDYVSDNISFSSTDIVTISFNNGSCI